MSGRPLVIAGIAVFFWLIGLETFGFIGIVWSLLSARRISRSRQARLADAMYQASEAAGPALLADLEMLERQLRDVERAPGLQSVGRQASEQLDTVHQKFLGFKDVLADRFGTGEMTYGRYFESAKQVYLSVIDGLRKSATMLRGIRAVDLDHIRSKLRHFERRPTLTDAEHHEIRALENRLRIHEQELESVRAILSDNEHAITQMVEATVALANVETAPALASMDTKSALTELEELALRSRKYQAERRG